MTRRTRRAFTMLETLMAAVLGSAVVLVCVGVLAGLDRTDRAAALRLEQTSALSRTHLVMRRTFGNVVMSDSSIRGGGPQPNPVATPAGAETPLPPNTRPRILLEPDTLARLPGGGSAAPQRLEVVLSKAPVPAVMNTARGESLAMASYEPSVYAGPALRGVFELRPDPAGARAKNWGIPGLDPRRIGWTLWWRPLPHHAEGPAGELFTLDPEQDPRAVAIASGLEKCHWIAFNKRTRADAFSATQFQDLPAYMELEIRTTTGLTAHWMFEVDWINGPETQEELEASEQMRIAQAGGGRPAAQPGTPAAGGAPVAQRGAAGTTTRTGAGPAVRMDDVHTITHADGVTRTVPRHPDAVAEDQAMQDSDARQRLEEIRRARTGGRR